MCWRLGPRGHLSSFFQEVLRRPDGVADPFDRHSLLNVEVPLKVLPCASPSENASRDAFRLASSNARMTQLSELPRDAATRSGPWPLAFLAVGSAPSSSNRRRHATAFTYERAPRDSVAARGRDGNAAREHVSREVEGRVPVSLWWFDLEGSRARWVSNARVPSLGRIEPWAFGSVLDDLQGAARQGLDDGPNAPLEGPLKAGVGIDPAASVHGVHVAGRERRERSELVHGSL